MINICVMRGERGRATDWAPGVASSAGEATDLSVEPGNCAERTGPGLEARESASPYSVLGYSLHSTELSLPPPAQSRPVMSTPGKAGQGDGLTSVDVKVPVQLQ